MSKTTTLHMHHAFLYISLLSLHNYDMKWPNFKFTWEREPQGDKFYHLCLNSVVVPLFSSNQNSPLLSKGRIGIIAKKFKRMRSLIFQRRFHGRRRCRIVSSLFNPDDGDDKNCKKAMGLAKQQLWTCIMLFCTFLSRCCTATTWKCLISRFVEDGKTRHQLSFYFLELWYSPFRIQLQKNLPEFDWRIKRNGIVAIEFEAARIHVLSDVFVEY